MYDADTGFPGLIIDGTACSPRGGESLSPSESYEDMVAGANRTRIAIGDSFIQIAARRVVLLERGSNSERQPPKVVKLSAVLG